MAEGKKKVVILGGGCASLTVAAELTNDPSWRDTFESITLYQMGWRLGGKGASGRARNCRIEEHGLHVWMGWYENAFKLMRTVYGELGRKEGQPLHSVDTAFSKHSYIVFGEHVEGEFKNWPIDFPTNEELPGTGGEFPSIWSYIEMGLKGLVKLLEHRLVTGGVGRARHRKPHTIFGKILYFFRRVFAWIYRVLRFIKVDLEILAIFAGEELLKEAHKVARSVSNDVRGHKAGHDDRMLWHLGGFEKWLKRTLRHELGHDDEARRLYFMLDFGITVFRGLRNEDIAFHGHSLDKLDKYDLREWLRKHGGNEDMIQSALITAFYDLLFAYRGGDPNDQRVATGVGLRFIFRMCLTYKGSIFWKMNAGMGDTIFGPMYEVLKKRGVEFKFFHRVRDVKLTADGSAVDTISIGRQAEVKSGEYEPLFDCQGLPCWPAKPFFEQLVEGEELERDDINLESFWTPWKEREKPFELRQGDDFDLIVFGISLGSIPYICKGFDKAAPKWKAMLDNVETVRTQAAQLWLKPNLKGLGWPLQSAVADAYPEPLNTWADMSHLIDRECWDPNNRPGNITYLCAPMIGGIPPEDDKNAPRTEADKVRAATVKWFEENTGKLWPDATGGGNSTGLNWDLLFDAGNATGPARFDTQFWRANIDPSERYVLSLPKTTEFRIHASERLFSNLFITGDWIYTAVNAGCVEGTVMSGMLTANAIMGRNPGDGIIGYNGP